MAALRTFLRSSAIVMVTRPTNFRRECGSNVVVVYTRLPLDYACYILFGGFRVVPDRSGVRSGHKLGVVDSNEWWMECTGWWSVGWWSFGMME